MLELSPNHPPLPVCGRIVFYKTSPWCQKGWALLKEDGKSRGKEGRQLELRASVDGLWWGSLEPCCCSVIVMSHSLWPHGLQLTRPPCPSLYPRVLSNSCAWSQWCHPTISSSYTSFFSCSQSFLPSIRVISNKSALCIKWLKYWSFSFSISPSNEYSGLISFRMDWLDILAVQGSLKSLLQDHSLKALIIWHSACFMVQLSNLYMTTGKTIPLTIVTFVGKVMSLFFNTLSRFGALGKCKAVNERSF